MERPSGWPRSSSDESGENGIGRLAHRGRQRSVTCARRSNVCSGAKATKPRPRRRVQNKDARMTFRLYNSLTPLILKEKNADNIVQRRMAGPVKRRLAAPRAAPLCRPHETRVNEAPGAHC